MEINKNMDNPFRPGTYKWAEFENWKAERDVPTLEETMSKEELEAYERERASAVDDFNEN